MSRFPELHSPAESSKAFREALLSAKSSSSGSKPSLTPTKDELDIEYDLRAIFDPLCLHVLNDAGHKLHFGAEAVPPMALRAIFDMLREGLDDITNNSAAAGGVFPHHAERHRCAAAGARRPVDETWFIHF